MKDIKATGQHKVNRVEVLTEEQEICLWEKDLLGDEQPQQLLDILISFIVVTMNSRDRYEIIGLQQNFTLYKTTL